MKTRSFSLMDRITRTRTSLTAACALLAAVGLPQGYMTFQGGCRYAGDDFEETLWTYDADEGARHALDRIMKHTGLPANFMLLGGNVDNAEASVKDGMRYIVFRPDFMEGVETGTGTNWASVSILAHEIGHHLAGHTLDGLGSRPGVELEADHFSGFVLCKMGASLEQANAAMNLIAHTYASQTHPGKAARLTAIADGWNEAMASGGPDNKEVIAPQITGTIQRMWVEHNVWWAGWQGMRIHAAFQIENGKGRKGELAAYFEFADGTRLQDFNGLYCTADGQVANHETFQPAYDQAMYNDFTLWLPYSELHLSNGWHQLQFHLVLFQQIGGKAVRLAESAEVEFPLAAY